MKAHGIHPSSPSKAAKAQETGDSDTGVTPAKRKANSTKAATPKKTPTKKSKKETALASAEKIVEKGSKVKVSITVVSPFSLSMTGANEWMVFRKRKLMRTLPLWRIRTRMSSLNSLTVFFWLRKWGWGIVSRWGGRMGFLFRGRLVF